MRFKWSSCLSTNADSSSHPSPCQSVKLWFGHASSSMYLICICDHMPITVMDLTPYAMVISAGVCPLWQMVTIISHNGVNTETRGKLWSEGLFTPKSNHTLNNVWLHQNVCFSFGLGTAAHFVHQNKHLWLLFFFFTKSISFVLSKCSIPFLNRLAVVLE